jgi:inorganic pyrophosphatase
MTIRSTDFLHQPVCITIDRPLGSRHPQHDFRYLLNYGYIAGTTAPDGEAIDAYVLAVFEPVKQFEGECIAMIQREDDEDDKLVVVPAGNTY